MSKSSRNAAFTSTVADLNTQARTIAAFVARMAGIDAEVAAEVARRAEADAEKAHMRAEDAYLSAQEAKKRFRELVLPGVSSV
ncbi:hypothetical protein IN842_15450 [Mycobacteroides abscessus subsp. abscessus]|uniref:hypothetical protein n=1 Tax=Mycobacteroides TaxID=670516 RepID=UPI0006C8B960|nr:MULTISPECIES: hypothetical protein [Mycobacteroides]KPG29285.1 hypothetical protein AN913_11385 [Mycobacteroides immunogenum]NOS08775.1 hypothetical protein [Mycobacteroides abscessus]NOS24527.1 hypothetical protein [Mycobacteroides abscessus]QSM41717.1 hypothetical protein IN842_15450 [Mycobacteroides abscessus subsp. abscessus]